MESDLETLRRRAKEAVDKSAIAENVSGIILQSDQDDEGGEFIRILIEVRDISRSNDDQLAMVLEEIERSIASVDHRYASVRFSEAA